MPRLVTFYIRHSVIGFGLAAVFVAGLIWADVMGLGALLTQNADGVLGAVFSMHEDTSRDADDDGPQGGVPVPVRVAVEQRKL